MSRAVPRTVGTAQRAAAGKPAGLAAAANPRGSAAAARSTGAAIAAPVVANDDPAGRKRQPPQVRRQMLLAAARSVIAERGLHATTVRDVAAAGDVAVGTVTYHFASMGEMLADVIAAEMSAFSAPVTAAAAAAPTGRETIRLVVTGLLADGEKARDHWRLWLDFWAMSARDERYAAWQREVYADLHALVRQGFERGAADGSLPATIDSRLAAVECVALLDGLVVQCYLPGAGLTPAQARDLLVDRFC